MTEQAWVTVREAGVLLRPGAKPMSRQGVAQLLRAGKLRGKRLAHLWLVSRASIQRWVAKGGT